MTTKTAGNYNRDITVTAHCGEVVLWHYNASSECVGGLPVRKEDVPSIVEAMLAAAKELGE